jgi:acyl-CoA synthetase (AMP-forming)/AMP-acid ligase II
VRPGLQTSEEDVRQALRARLSSYKVPRRVVFVEADQIPRTSTGKVKLHELAILMENWARI